MFHAEHWPDAIVVEDIRIPFSFLVTTRIYGANTAIDTVHADLVGSQTNDRAMPEMREVDYRCSMLSDSMIVDPDAREWCRPMC